MTPCGHPLSWPNATHYNAPRTCYCSPPLPLKPSLPPSFNYLTVPSKPSPMTHATGPLTPAPKPLISTTTSATICTHPKLPWPLNPRPTLTTTIHLNWQPHQQYNPLPKQNWDHYGIFQYIPIAALPNNKPTGPQITQPITPLFLY